MTRPGKGWIIETPVWHEVKLPTLRGFNRYQDQQRRSKEIRRWLVKNCGTDGIFWREKQDHEDSTTVYLFRTEEAAFLFKMIWL